MTGGNTVISMFRRNGLNGQDSNLTEISLLNADNRNYLLI